jgi:hypothetical protein
VYPGIYVNVNDHVDLRENAPTTWAEGLRWALDAQSAAPEWTHGAGPAVEALHAVWPEALERSDQIFERVMKTP